MLSPSKVVAGGAAAATTAVLGSYFGMLGTVGGAAATSIVTAVSSELYQRSLQRTGARLRSQPGAATGSPDTYTQPSRVAAPPRGRVWPKMAFGSLVIFALAIGAVSGIELVRGAPLSGGRPGTTTVGYVSHGSAPLPLVPALHDSTRPLVGNLVGSDEQPDKSSDQQSGEQQNKPGLVTGVLSGL